MIKPTFALLLGIAVVSCGGEHMPLPSSDLEGLNGGMASNENETSVIEKVTFTRDILPIVTEKCHLCHNAGPLNWENYETAKLYGPTFVGRLRGTSGMQMPLGQQQLSEEEILLFEDWQSDGFLK